MRLIDILLRLSESSPGIPLHSDLLKPLKRMYPRASEKRYAGSCLIMSIAVCVLCLVILLGIGEDPLYSVFCFALGFGFLLMLPGLEMKRRAEAFEARLPLTLRTLGMLLEMRIPFMHAIEKLASDEPEFALVADEVSNGITVQRALSGIALKYDSVPIKRAISQLITSYEVGGSGAQIRKIGDEMLSSQRHRLREYSSKSAIFGLLFIVSAALLPTFFIVYSVLGGYTAEGSMDNIMMGLAMLVVFPLISLSVLLLGKSMLPSSALESADTGADMIVVAPTGILVLSLLLLPKGLIGAGIVIGLASSSYIIYSRFENEKKVEEIEKHLPDALFSVSGLPRSAKMEEIFGVIERSGYGALSEEAAKSRSQIESNLSVQSVLEDLSSRNRSPMLDRASQMLSHVFSTNSFEQLNRLAEDMLAFLEVRRERAGLLAMQKYTLVFGGLIVPLILRITLNLLSSMAQFFEKSDAATQLDFASSLIPAYIVIYALLSSIYISNIDERRSRSAGYFLAIVVVGLATFFFINV